MKGEGGGGGGGGASPVPRLRSLPPAPPSRLARCCGLKRAPTQPTGGGHPSCVCCPYCCCHPSMLARPPYSHPCHSIDKSIQSHELIFCGCCEWYRSHMVRPASQTASIGEPNRWTCVHGAWCNLLAVKLPGYSERPSIQPLDRSDANIKAVLHRKHKKQTRVNANECSADPDRNANRNALACFSQ